MKKPINTQKYYRLEDISEIFDIPLSTLRRWASERRFPLYKISNLIRVSLEEFEEWWHKQRVRGVDKIGH